MNRADLKVRRFFKINSDVEGCKIMNALCNKIKKDFDFCIIEVSGKKLQFVVVFDKEEEENLDDLEENNVLEEEKCEIKVELAQTEKDEYLLSLFKKCGDIEEFYENFEKVKKSINSLL